MADNTHQQTTMAGPVHLLEPTVPPAPTQGCDVCAALDRRRTECTAGGDPSGATECSVEIGHHPHEDGHAVDGADHVQAAYCAYLSHSTGCEGCGHGATKCPEATRLWREYREARSS